MSFPHGNVTEQQKQTIPQIFPHGQQAKGQKQTNFYTSPTSQTSLTPGGDSASFSTRAPESPSVSDGKGKTSNSSTVPPSDCEGGVGAVGTRVSLPPPPPPIMSSSQNFEMGALKGGSLGASGSTALAPERGVLRRFLGTEHQIANFKTFNQIQKQAFFESFNQELWKMHQAKKMGNHGVPPEFEMRSSKCISSYEEFEMHIEAHLEEQRKINQFQFGGGKGGGGKFGGKGGKGGIKGDFSNGHFNGKKGSHNFGFNKNNSSKGGSNHDVVVPMHSPSSGRLLTPMERRIRQEDAPAPVCG